MEKFRTFSEEVNRMTDMKRVTISVTDEIDRRIIDLRKKDPRFERCSYAEIVRQVLALGMESYDSTKDAS